MHEQKKYTNGSEKPVTSLFARPPTPKNCEHVWTFLSRVDFYVAKDGLAKVLLLFENEQKGNFYYRYSTKEKQHSA